MDDLLVQSLEAKLSTAEEKRTAQLKEVKEKLGDHMDKIEKAQKVLELQIEVRSATCCAAALPLVLKDPVRPLFRGWLFRLQVNKFNHLPVSIEFFTLGQNRYTKNSIT